LITGGVLTATGNITGSNIVTAGLVSATGNVSGNNFVGSGRLIMTGNANVANLYAGGLLTATGNITGANLITTGLVSVTGNVTSGNVTTGIVDASGNILAGGHLVVTGNAVANNLSVTNYVKTALVPYANVTYDLGSETHRWRDLWLSGNSLKLGTATISATGDGGIAIASATVTGNIDVGNITATAIGGTLTTANQPSITSLGTLSGLTVSGDMVTGNLSVSGDTVLTGNTSVTGTFEATTITGTIVIPPGANLAAPGNSSQIMFNDDGNAAAVPGMTFDKTSNLLSISGNVSGGNLITSGSVGGALATGTLNSLGANSITANGNVVAGNLVTVGILSTSAGLNSGANIAITAMSGTGAPSNVVTVTFATQSTTPFSGGTIINITGATPSGYNGEWTALSGNANTVTFTSSLSSTVTSLGRIRGGGNLVTNGFLQVVGNASVGNITTTTLSGQVVSVSGNVSGANLIASGVLRVDGNANVGNLTTSGFVSAATIAASASLTGQALVSNTTIGASGTITGGNLSTTGTLSAGNASLGNISSVSNISMNGNLTGASLMESGLLNVTGNMTGGNVITNGFLQVSGTATVGNVVANNRLTIQNTASVGSQLSVGSNLAIATLVGTGGPTNVVTIGFAEQSTPPFPAGATIVVSGVTGVTAFNGSYTVATGNTTAVTISSSTSGLPGLTSARVRTGGVGLNITGNASMTNMTLTGLIAAEAATANLGTINSTTLSVTGNIGAGNLEVGQTLSVTGNSVAGNITSNGTLTANGALTTQTASINGGLTVGVNLSLTGIAPSSTGVVQANFAGQLIPPFASGSSVTVAGVTPSEYNGTFTVTDSASNYVRFASATTGATSVLGSIRTAGVSLSIVGNTSVTNLEASSFDVTTANATTLNIPTGGILSMATANASIGNIAAGILATEGNISSANGNVILSNGYLSVSGNVTASRVSVANAIVSNTYAVGGQMTVGSNVAITGASGTGSVVTLTYASQTSAPFPAGASILVSGITPVGYNGTFTVTSSNTTAVVFSHTATGSLTVQGFARTSGVGLILQSTANVGGLNTSGGTINAGSGAITGGTFTATLFSGNGASITGINMFNAGMSVVITATAGTGTVSTLSFATQSYAPFSIGQSITVSGVTPSGYNGTFTVTSCTTSAVTYAHTATGSMSVAGVITSTAKAGAAALADTVTNPLQTNITRVGTLSELTLNGALSGTDLTSSGFFLASVGSGLSATGTTLSGALGLTKQVNVVTSVAIGVNDGVRLPAATVGMQIIIINFTASPLKVYPANGGSIDDTSMSSPTKTNQPFSLGAGARLMVVAATTQYWFTMTGVYG